MHKKEELKVNESPVARQNVTFSRTTEAQCGLKQPLSFLGEV